MVVAALYALFILSTGVTVSTLFLIMALMNAVVALFIFKLVPEFIMRLLIWLVVHSVYRVDKIDLDKIPDTGPAVLICNHVSFVDALILAGSIKRPIRFVMYFRIYQLPILSFIFKTAKAIPIASPNEHSGLMKLAFNRISEALEDGELVCIFPEGKITETGDIGQFKSGVIRILERDPVPVIPLALRGLWGSFFSRKYGKPMTRWFPRGWFSRIQLVAGNPIKAIGATQESLNRRVSVLRGKKP
jgi:hypothetical protein